MKRFTIIWDFDGTILSSDPCDSEQTLMLYRVNDSRETIPFSKKVVAKAAIYADRREWLRGSFKKYYLWVLKGTKIEAVDRVSESLVKKIPKKDRQIFLKLKENGHNMFILSCGTLDLIERVLKIAGLSDCFSMILGNRFQLLNDRITGMNLQILNPKDKLKMVNKLDIHPEQSIVVGDGYTDLPLLDWAGIPVLIDRTGGKKKRYVKKDYYFISSISELLGIVNESSVRKQREASVKREQSN